MGPARLLAKGWVLMCLYAGAHALRFALQSGGDPLSSVPQVVVSVLLFAAMGLLFVGGYGASGGNFHLRRFNLAEFKLPHSLPGFNEVVFLLFVVLSFVNQVAYAPLHVSGQITNAFEGALFFAVPGQRAVVETLGACALDGGRVFSSSFAWLLAIIFAGSAISRLKLTAGIIRLERAAHPEALGPTAVAAVLGIAAVLAIQCIFVGSVMQLMPCSAFAGVPGALLIGLSPLLLAYLIFAALATLLASGSEA
jgi:hypothetical protein